MTSQRRSAAHALGSRSRLEMVPGKVAGPRRLLVSLASDADWLVAGPRSLASAVGGVPRGGLVDLKQRPDIGASVAASLTGELWFKVGKLDVIGPAIGIDDGQTTRSEFAAVFVQRQASGRARLGPVFCC